VGEGPLRPAPNRSPFPRLRRRPSIRAQSGRDVCSPFPSCFSVRTVLFSRSSVSAFHIPLVGLLLAMIVSMGTVPAAAQVPRLLHYQATLAEGSFPVEGAVDLEVAFFGQEEDGSPRLKDVEIEEWLSESLIRQTYGVDPSILRVFRVSGDAMKKILCPGDRIRAALWQGEALTEGSIYLFYQDPGGVLVRRVWIDGNQVRLVAEHSEVPALTLEAGSWSDDFRPVARVLEVIRPL